MPRLPHPDQFDLFARPAVPAPDGPAGSEPQALARLATDRLLDRLAWHVYREAQAEPEALMRELGRRGDGRAVPLLLRAWRRAVAGGTEEWRAAQRALADLGPRFAGDAGDELMVLARTPSASAAARAGALLCLAVLHYAPAAALIDEAAGAPAPELRLAACELASALGRRGAAAALLALTGDPDRQVARAACLALGRLGEAGAKPALEAMLVRAAPLDLPAVIAALAPVADDDSAQILGRVAERSDEAGRLAVVEALGMIAAPAAIAALARLARDPRPAVRLAVVAALSRHEPGPETAQPLGWLLRDGDVEVRAAAEEALKAFEPGW